MILALARHLAPPLPPAGCWPVCAGLDFLRAAAWHERALAEHDERLLQPITYLVLHDAQGRVWSYARSGGDTRVLGRRSIGVGGHVDAGDACHDAQGRLDPAVTLRHALLRELREELAAQADALTEPRLRAAIYEGHSAIGRVHLGLLYSARWLHAQAPQPCAGEALEGLGFVALADVASDARYELWSRLAAGHLLAHAAPPSAPVAIP